MHFCENVKHIISMKLRSPFIALPARHTLQDGLDLEHGQGLPRGQEQLHPIPEPLVEDDNVAGLRGVPLSQAVHRSQAHIDW